MASYNGTAITSTPPVGGWRRGRTWMGSPTPLPAVVTFWYRAANGSTRGSTTVLASVPAGSVIERIGR